MFSCLGRLHDAYINLTHGSYQVPVTAKSLILLVAGAGFDTCLMRILARAAPHLCGHLARFNRISSIDAACREGDASFYSCQHCVDFRINFWRSKMRSETNSATSAFPLQ